MNPQGNCSVVVDSMEVPEEITALFSRDAASDVKRSLYVPSPLLPQRILDADDVRP